ATHEDMQARAAGAHLRPRGAAPDDLLRTRIELAVVGDEAIQVDAADPGGHREDTADARSRAAVLPGRPLRERGIRFDTVGKAAPRGRIGRGRAPRRVAGFVRLPRRG